MFVLLLQLVTVSVLGQQTYKVGDLITAPDGSMGIVYYLFSDGSGGWAVALDDLAGSYKWCDTAGTFIPYDSFLLVNPNLNTHDTAGYLNTHFLREYSSEVGGAVPFEHGWYLPAVKQLTVLLSQLPIIEPVLQQYGTPLAYDQFWSSTIHNAVYALVVDFGSSPTLSRTNIKAQGISAKVRAVRTFIYSPVEYDTSLTYQWNTGSTQPYINPSPQQTTTYTVTATNESGCSATDSKTIFVAENMPQEFYDEICQGEPYDANGFTISATETSTPGLITRTRTVTNDGCSATVTLYLTVHPTATTEINEEGCGTYLWNGVTLYEEGNYEQHFLTANGCDSTVILHLTLHTPDTTHQTESACNSYTLNGISYNYSGTYTQHLTNGNGCYSMVILDLTILPTQHTDVDTTVYNNLHWGNSYWTETGDYSVTYTNQFGCDSIVTIHLTVIQRDTTYVDSTICDSALPLEWNGMTITGAGTETVTLHPSELYDSVVVITLHVNPTMTSTSSVTVCDSYSWAGETYTQSGVYTKTFTNRFGCDSTVTLTLTVSPSVAEDIAATVCDSYDWAGETYTQSGTYTKTFSTINGCDSTVTLHLTVHHSDSVMVDTLVCPQSLPVTVRGFTFAGAGTQTITAPNIHGCDSTTTVHVSLSDTTTASTALTVCDSYSWYGITYTESGTYEHIAINADGCSYKRRVTLTVFHSDTTYADSTCCQNQLPLSWNGRVFSAAGTQSKILTNQGGCDSLVVMTVHVNDGGFSTFDTTVCGQFVWAGSLYTQSGTFMKTFSSVAGCDSIVFAHVTVLQPPVTLFDTTVCAGDLPMVWHDSLFEHADTLSFTTVSATGCDSTVVFRLRVAHPDTVMLTVTACDVFEWDGEEYYESDTLTGVFTNIQGCDSTVTLYLTVNSSETTTTSATACGEYGWAGETFTESGEYERTFTSANGCDSVVSLLLTVYPTATELVETTICEDSLPYQWNGMTFNGAGTRSLTLQTVEGCDSVVTMTLHVSNIYQLIEEKTICEDSLPYSWNGVIFNDAGTQSVSLQTVEGCDSVVTMTLHVSNIYQLNEDKTICEDSLPYSWNGVIFNNAGTQSVTLQTAEGCDSVVTMTLHVSNIYQLTEEKTICEDSLPYSWNGVIFNDAGTQSVILQTAEGCDSVVTMVLHVSNIYQLTEEKTICEDSLPYSWNGVIFNDAGTQSVSLQTAEGCDSVVTMILLVSNTYQLTEEKTICEDSLPYQWNGVTFNNAGTQSVALQSVEGCDSVVTIILHVSSIYQMTEEKTICEDSLPYSWNGVTFHSAGTQSVTLQTVEGCDSVVTMILHVTNLYQMTENRTVCEDSLPYHWNGATFNNAGTQSVTLQTVNGCDSIITMVLHVSNRYDLTQNRTVCEDSLPYHWNGVTFNNASTQSVTLQTVNGCDSIITMALHVSNRYDLTQNRTVCANELPHLWNGVTFAGADTQSVTLQTVDGCDSVVTMVLLVSDTSHTDWYENACDEYQWNDTTYYESGNHVQLLTNVAGCDSVVTLHLTLSQSSQVQVDVESCGDYEWKGETYGESGDYEQTLTSASGCDSVVTLHLTVIDTALQIISLTEDFCEGMSAELVAVTGMTDYLWNTGEELPNITVTQPGIYSVTASQSDCHATARYTVEACDFHLWLPNAISPSKSDGLNDVFSLPLRVQSMIDEFEISIFNRWGEQVFYSNDKAFKWDGSIEGKRAVSTVYNYVIRCTVIGGKPYRFTGSVTVL